jgi:hypothetical protein
MMKVCVFLEAENTPFKDRLIYAPYFKVAIGPGAASFAA